MAGISGEGSGTESVWVTCGERGASRRAATPCAVGGISGAGGAIPEAAAAIDLLSVLYSLNLQQRSRLARVSATTENAGSSPMLATEFCEQSAGRQLECVKLANLSLGYLCQVLGRVARDGLTRGAGLRWRRRQGELEFSRSNSQLGRSPRDADEICAVLGVLRRRRERSQSPVERLRFYVGPALSLTKSRADDFAIGDAAVPISRDIQSRTRAVAALCRRRGRGE